MKLCLFLLVLFSFSAFTLDLKTITLTSQNVVVLNDEFNPITTAILSQKIMEKMFTLVDEPLYVVLNTPGGDVDSGLAMITFMNSFKRDIRVIVSFAASMGFLTTQLNNGTRYILPFGTLMSHPMRVGGVTGEVSGNLNSRVNYFTEMLNQIDVLITDRNKTMTIDAYKKLYNDEYWCIGQQCINDGFADEMIIATCDESLKGTHHEKVDTMFGTFDVEFSDCPMIAGPLKINSVDQKAVNEIREKYNRTTTKVSK